MSGLTIWLSNGSLTGSCDEAIAFDDGVAFGAREAVRGGDSTVVNSWMSSMVSSGAVSSVPDGYGP